MDKVINSLCEANSISSKGNTEIRGNKVKDIGMMLLETPGLAEAMAKYMTPVVFDKAFQQYIDNAKPELKAAAKRLGDSSNTYCRAVKTQLAATSGWLWKRGDAESVLEDVYYRQMLCVESIRRLAGLSGHMNFEDAMNHLRNAVLDENKVPTEFLVKKYPALQHFFELISKPTLSRNDVKILGEIIEQQDKVIREVFFDMGQAWQLGAMREIFGEVWPKMVAESIDLYNAFPPDSARADIKSFKAIGRGKIEEFSRTLVSKQIIALWRTRTHTESPDEWSRKYALPSECVLVVDDAKSAVDAVADPGSASAERLQLVLKNLEKDGAFVDENKAGEFFLKRVLPARYQKMGFSVSELSEWLLKKLGSAPGRWLNDVRLQEAVEAFVKQGYDTHARRQAAEKVNMLSDAEAKKLLLTLIDQIPDVGLTVLE